MSTWYNGDGVPPNWGTGEERIFGDTPSWRAGKFSRETAEDSTEVFTGDLSPTQIKWVYSLSPDELARYVELREQGVTFTRARQHINQERTRGAQKQPKRKSNMKTKSEFRNIAAMLSDEIVSVACTFHTGGKEYTYKAERTLELNKGDLVVVSANDGGYKVVTVVDAHKDCMLEDADTVDYQWVLSVVSPARLEELQAWEDKIADDLYYQQRAHAKKQMLAALGFDGVASLPTGLPAPEESSEVIDEE